MILIDKLLTGDPKEILKNALKVTILTALTITGTQAVNGLVANLQARLDFPMEAAAIEQMRFDTRGLDCRIAAQVTASIIDTNKRIADRQKANALWYMDR